MKTFALKQGDLVLTGDRFAMVDGAARVQQQLSLALAEPFGGDRFHPRWGSVLHNWIGTTIGQNTTEYIQAEVNRVIRNFIMAQNAALAQRSSLNRKPTLTLDEIISEVTEIRVEQNADAMIVKVGIRTSGQQEFAVLTAPSRSI